MIPLIDCHALIASPELDLYPLDPDAAPAAPAELEASLSPDGLAAALDAGLAGAVLVQRGRFYGFNNRLVTDAAAHDPRLRALCAVDTGAPGCVAAAERLLAMPGVAGLRFMEPRKGADLDWLTGNHARGVWKAIAERGALADVHVFPWNRDEGLAAVAGLAREFAEVPILIDNVGAAAVEQGAPDFGVDPLLAAFADLASVTLKFSEMTLGRLARAGLDARTAVARFASLVGSGRLCWGSDVLPPDTGYEQALAHAEAATASLDEAGRRSVLHANAARLFGFG